MMNDNNTQIAKSLRAGMPRREWISKTLGLLGVAGLIPALYADAENHVENHAENHAENHHEMAPDEAPAADWKPVFFNTEQNETLIALSEAIVPGSTSAQCNRIIDVVMTVEAPKHQNDFTAALAKFNSESNEKYDKPFAQTAPGQQTELLTAAFTPKSKLWNEANIVKEWTADSYWTSQQGLKELGWTGRFAWTTYPGCDRPTHTS